MRLRDLGNTVIVVNTAKTRSDWRTISSTSVRGRCPRRAGGCPGSYADILAVPESITGQHLSGALQIDNTPVERRADTQALAQAQGCQRQQPRTSIWRFRRDALWLSPGSGSGKSTLINRHPASQIAATS